MDPNRLKALSGIETTDDEFSASYEREKKIEALIRHAFEKIGLEINYNNHSVNYDDGTREATITLEEISVPLQALNRLFETGLSDQFTIGSYSEGMTVTFKVSHDLDHATIATTPHSA